MCIYLFGGYSRADGCHRRFAAAQNSQGQGNKNGRILHGGVCLQGRRVWITCNGKAITDEELQVSEALIESLSKDANAAIESAGQTRARL